MPHWHTLADFFDETDLIQKLKEHHHATEWSDRSVGFGHSNRLSIDDSGCLNLGTCLLLGPLLAILHMDAADAFFTFRIQDKPPAVSNMSRFGAGCSYAAPRFGPAAHTLDFHIRDTRGT